MPLIPKNAVELTKHQGPSGAFWYSYVFLCNKCGKKMNVGSGKLKRHSGSCIHCWKASLPVDTIKASYKILKRNQRKVEVNITFEEYRELCSKEFCEYCGIKIDRSFEPGRHSYRNCYLDRKNSKAPYSKSNCVPCCADCNKIKNNILSYDEMKVAMKAVLEYRNESSASKIKIAN